MTIKKKFKVRIKGKGTKSVQGVKEVAPTSRANEDRIIRAAAAEGLLDVQAKYEALLGRGRPIDQALCGDRAALQACLEHIEDPLLKAFEGGGAEIGVQVTRIATSPIIRARLSVPAGKRALSVYRMAKVDGIAGFRICPTVNPDTGTDCMALDLIAIIGGPEARLKVDDANLRSRSRTAFRRSNITWAPSGDRPALHRALTWIFEPPWIKLPSEDPLYDPDEVFDDDNDPGRRALITLMCRSQLPLRRMLTYFGAGKPIGMGAIGTVEHALKQRCRAGPEVLSRDEVPHFCFDELRRLGLDGISVPVIKLH